PAVADSRAYGAMNNAPAKATRPASPAPVRKRASTISAFFTRLSFRAPHAWDRQSGPRRRDISSVSGDPMAEAFESELRVMTPPSGPGRRSHPGWRQGSGSGDHRA